MAIHKLNPRKNAPSNPHYAWLERARAIFSHLSESSDPAALEGIIAEGKARLIQIDNEDSALHGYIQLTVAEAHMNLSLEANDEDNALELGKAGIETCKGAIESALVETAGTICAVLPRALTLLTAFYRAVPDTRNRHLEKLISDSAQSLDSALATQSVLREQAVETYNHAMTLITALNRLDHSDRSVVLNEAADALLTAGNFAAQAGDTRLIHLVQQTLKQIEEAFEDTDIVISDLPIFQNEPSADELLPVFNEGLPAEEAPEEAIPKHRGDRGGIRKAISALGLMISLGMAAFSGYSLIGRSLQMVNFSEGETESGEELNPRALTQEAIYLQLTGIAYVEVPTGTAVPQESGTGAAESAPESADLPVSAIEGLTGLQARTSYSMFDDFSSKALGWPEYDNGVTIQRYEDGAYRFQHRGKGNFEKVFWPVDFVPVEARFDVRAQEGDQGGTFGVFCHFQDQNNYYYVEVDLLTKEYIIMQIADGKLIPLTAQNDAGSFWQPAIGLQPNVNATNNFGVTCYMESITFLINDTRVDEVEVQQPVDFPGLGAFIVYTFDFAGDEGYTVWFDNVELWEPVQ